MLTTLLSSKEIYRATCKITYQESKKPFIDIFIFTVVNHTVDPQFGRGLEFEFALSTSW